MLQAEKKSLQSISQDPFRQTLREVVQLQISSCPGYPLFPIVGSLPPLKVAPSETLFTNCVVSYSLGRTFPLCLCLSDLAGIQIHTEDLDVYIFSLFKLVFSFSPNLFLDIFPSRTSHISFTCITLYSLFSIGRLLGGCPYKQLSAQFSSYVW